MPTHRTVDGADLYTDADAALVVGEGNYVRAENVTYDDGAETLLPGWERYLTDFGGNPPSLIHHAENAARQFDALVFTPAKIFRRNDAADGWDVVGSSFDTTNASRWRAVTLQSTTVATNGWDPVIARSVTTGGSFLPIRELREVGVISAGTVAQVGGFLMLGDVTELLPERRNEWLNTAADPYGDRPPEAWLTRTPSRLLWSDSVSKWKLVGEGTIGAGSTVIVSDFRIYSLQVGDKLSFVEAGEQPATADDISTTILNEATIVAISPDRRSFELDKANTSGNPATGYFFRDDYFEQISGYDDTIFSGRILATHSLGEQLIACMDEGFLLVTPTGDSLSPFAVEVMTRTRDSALAYPNACVPIDDRYLVYRGRSSWFLFDLATRRPVPHDRFDQCDSLFAGLQASDAEAFFAVDNELTQTVWICLPDRLGFTVTWDYRNNKVRTIDATWSALGAVKHPLYGNGAPRDWMWLLGNADTDGTVDNWRYATSDGAELYTRRGEPYTGTIQYAMAGTGMYSLRFTKLDVLLSSRSPSHPITVRLEAFDHANGTPRTIIDDRVLTDPRLRSEIRCNARGAHFQDTLSFSGPVQIAGRSHETTQHMSRLRGRGKG
jgi:hypothetical protein